MLGAMAGGTGHAIVRRQTPVVEEPAPESNALRRGWLGQRGEIDLGTEGRLRNRDNRVVRLPRRRRGRSG